MAGTFAAAAVMRPLPSTVNEGIELAPPNAPTLALTVASVVASEPPGVVISPVRAGKFAAGSAPVIVEVERLTVNPAPVAPPVRVPTDVSDDAVTVAFSVAPVSVPAGAALSGNNAPGDTPLSFVQIRTPRFVIVQSPEIGTPTAMFELLPT